MEISLCYPHLQMFFLFKRLYWKILHLCNHKVVSKQGIMEHLTNTSQEVEDAILELFDEYLIYANDDLSEIVSLINTDLIYH